MEATKNNTPKIAFVIPYYGRFPAYFSLFFDSIKDAPLDIIMFAESMPTMALPANVKVNLKPYAEIQQLFNSKLGIKVAFDKPYKFCDLKPTYGYIFEEYLKEYDYWGSIDTDLIVGNFAKFVNADTLNNIDFFSGIKEYVSGSFFLFRNTERCNTLFMKSRDWQKCFQEVEYTGFDECGGNFFQDLKDGKSIFDIKTNIHSLTEVIFTEQQQGLNCYFEDVILEPSGEEAVTVNKGQVLYRGKEYLLVHFIYFKATYYFHINPTLKPTYYINSLGTFKKFPSKVNMFFSANFFNACRNKVNINLRKIHPKLKV
ncbi:DUF6625 family protein [Mucilaginibacter terrae]|uniref:Nucleotide-diphospho-sugar transferase domain-containing protein n=1 Tax=Mucilaginibacter terrae TaxID=1955052 RepID=A0ABU3H1I4_9SPHI|nr:DUF6625 family protein [Mucilaginibacter terrae]MDT3404780.1 hypothetical protein [Mucilaginibacter terrae]